MVDRDMTMSGMNLLLLMTIGKCGAHHTNMASGNWQLKRVPNKRVAVGFLFCDLFFFFFFLVDLASLQSHVHLHTIDFGYEI